MWWIIGVIIAIVTAGYKYFGKNKNDTMGFTEEEFYFITMEHEDDYFGDM